jgi:hypothetical protein
MMTAEMKVSRLTITCNIKPMHHNHINETSKKSMQALVQQRL